MTIHFRVEYRLKTNRKTSILLNIIVSQVFSTCTAYERYVLKRVLQALVQTLRDGEHIRNQAE